MEPSPPRNEQIARAHGNCARVSSFAARVNVATLALDCATCHGRLRAKPCCFIDPRCPAYDHASSTSFPGDGNSTGTPPRTFFVGSRRVAESRNRTRRSPMSKRVTIPPRAGSMVAIAPVWASVKVSSRGSVATRAAYQQRRIRVATTRAVRAPRPPVAAVIQRPTVKRGTRRLLFDTGEGIDEHCAMSVSDAASTALASIFESMLPK